MEKLERQLKLLATLLHTEHPLRAAQIQTLVDYPEDTAAFRRAFERDKDDLRRIGIPITIEQLPFEDAIVACYQIKRTDYYLHDLDLEPDEVIALSMAMRLIRLEGEDSTDDPVWKLGGARAGGEGAVPLGAMRLGPSVAQMHEAIAERAVVEFAYRDVTRVVEPWRLSFRRGRWYLDGYDLDRADERRFRLDRIDGAVEVGGPGTARQARPEPAGERQPWQFGTEDQTVQTATVRVSAGLAAWARRQPGIEAVVERDDGSIDVSIEVSNVAGFRSLVLGWGADAEVLEPPELRAAIIDWLEAQT